MSKSLRIEEVDQNESSSEKMQARNFAVALVQQLGNRFDRLEAHFPPKGMKIVDFVQTLAPVILSLYAMGEDDDIRTTPHEVSDLVTRAKSGTRFSPSGPSAELAKRKERLQHQRLESQVEGHLRKLQQSSTNGKTVDFFANKESMECALWELFLAIDHSNKGTVCWPDFVAYLIDATMRGGTQDDLHGRKYGLSGQTLCSHVGAARVLTYEPGLDKLMVLGRFSEIKILDPKTFNLWRSIALEPEWGATIVGCYLGDFGCFAVSTGDCKIRFLGLDADLEGDQRRISNISIKTLGMKTSQTAMLWSHNKNILYTGGRDGIVRAFLIKPNGVNQTTIVPSMELKSFLHKDAVTDLLVLPYDAALVTCSLDTLIYFLNPTNFSILLTFRGHQKGVLSLSYSRTYNLLVSSGIEYHALCWMINMPHSPPIPLKDGWKDHKDKIIRNCTVSGGAHVLTQDVNGMIKLWDLRNFRVIQTMYCEQRMSPAEMAAMVWTPLAYMEERKCFMIAAKRQIYQFEFNYKVRTRAKTAADDFGITKALVITNNQTVMVAVKDSIRLWDLSRGCVAVDYNELCGADITCMCMDTACRKVFVGCHDGQVQAFNINSGTQLGKCNLGGEIVDMLYVDKEDYIVVVDCEGQIIVLDLDMTKYHLCKTSKARNSKPLDAIIVAYNKEANHILAGEGTNTLSIWDAEASQYQRQSGWKKVQQCNNTPLDNSVDCLHVLEGKSMFISSDSAGGLHLWYTGWTNRNYSCILRWVGYQPPQAPYTPTVCGMGFVDEACLLYTADDYGGVCVYSFGMTFGVWDDYMAGKFPSLTKEPRLPRPAVVHYWAAHKEYITSLVVVTDPCYYILTAGSDCHMYLWTMAGNKIETCKKKGAINWEFVIDGETEADRHRYYDIPEEWDLRLQYVSPDNPAPQHSQRTVTFGNVQEKTLVDDKGQIISVVAEPNSGGDIPSSPTSPTYRRLSVAKELELIMGGGLSISRPEITSTSANDNFLASLSAPSGTSTPGIISPLLRPGSRLHSAGTSVVSLTLRDGQILSDSSAPAGPKDRIKVDPAPLVLTQPITDRSKLPPPPPTMPENHAADGEEISIRICFDLSAKHGKVKEPETGSLLRRSNLTNSLVPLNSAPCHPWERFHELPPTNLALPSPPVFRVDQSLSSSSKHKQPRAKEDSVVSRSQDNVVGLVDRRVTDLQGRQPLKKTRSMALNQPPKTIPGPRMSYFHGVHQDVRVKVKPELERAVAELGKVSPKFRRDPPPADHLLWKNRSLGHQDLQSDAIEAFHSSMRSEAPAIGWRNEGMFNTSMRSDMASPTRRDAADDDAIIPANSNIVRRAPRGTLSSLGSMTRTKEPPQGLESPYQGMLMSPLYKAMEAPFRKTTTATASNLTCVDFAAMARAGTVLNKING